MTDETPPIQSPTLPSSHLSVITSNSALSVEVAKCLKLVAPASMGADAQLSWIASAVDALEGIRADEVSHISPEIRRTVTRPAQIVPEIARLVAERRKHYHGAQEEPTGPSLWSIHREGRARMDKANTRAEIEDAQTWERQALLDGGFPVRPIEPPLSRDKLDNLPRDIVALGLKGGFLERRGGKLYELDCPR